MKKFFLLSFSISSLFAANAQLENYDGIPVLTDAYAQKVSHDGTQFVAETIDGSTGYYNSATGQLFYYEGCSFGLGYNVSDNGWIVGSQAIDDQFSRAIIMSEGQLIYPSVFNPLVYGNIHSITPDGSRICGVVGNEGRGPSYLPFYCDIDENGNLGEIQLLPTPNKDFFDSAPQYCSATWISEDGKTIAGQVVQSRGFFVYPIIYSQDNNGNWSYSFPSQPLFNPENLPIPKPLGDFDDEYPDVPYPEYTDFMTPQEAIIWNNALTAWNNGTLAEDPYDNLDLYMTPDELYAFIEAANRYNDAVYEYNELNEKYWDDMFEIANQSVFFVRNQTALSADGQWLASAALIEDTSDPFEIVAYYVPYLFNLKTDEYYKIGQDNENLLVNQVLPGGTVIISSLPDPGPAVSWIYYPETKQRISILEYLQDKNPEYADWLISNFTDDIITGESPDGELDFTNMTVTGRVSASEDLSVICGAVDGYTVGWNMLLTYIFDGLPATGIQTIETETPSHGIFRVFNLQGHKLLETKNPEEIRSLPRGIYIINNKKVFLP